MHHLKELQDLQKENNKLWKLLYKHGICSGCGELYEQQDTSNIASCACHSMEFDTLTPHMEIVRRLDTGK